MTIEEEKKLIYTLMREIITERRELTNQYYELKYTLDNLEDDLGDKKQAIKTDESFEQIDVSKKSLSAEVQKYYPKTKKIPFERVAGYVIEILKEFPVPLSNKCIYRSLIEKYSLVIEYKNFTSNVLPKMNNLEKFPIERAYRGYWQYARGRE